MDKGKSQIKDLLDRYFDGLLNNEETGELFRLVNEGSYALEDQISTLLPPLSPVEVSFPHKNRLHKSYSDLDETQFETLCIAGIEGDLSPSQWEEIKSVLESDPEKNRVYESYKKIRLEPETMVYQGKFRLKKLTASVRIIRLAAIPLSIAASITILITALNFFGRPAEETIRPDILAESGNIQVVEKQASMNNISEVRIQNTEQKIFPGKVMNEEAQSVINSTGHGFIKAKEVIEIVPERTSMPEPVIMATEIPFTGLAMTTDKLAEVILTDPLPYERPSIRETIASGFREKLLGEKSPDSSPLKGYEIAGVGINGINKLLGWEMDLQARKEVTGEVNALAFNSRLIKVQTPVKRASPDEQ